MLVLVLVLELELELELELVLDTRLELEVVVGVCVLDNLDIREVEVIVPVLEDVRDDCDETAGVVDAVGAVDARLFDAVDAGASDSAVCEGVGKNVGSGT